LSRGYEVWGTSRDAQVSPSQNLVQLDIRDRVRTESMAVTDFRSVIQVLPKVRPLEVYNLAGQSSVGLSFQQPVETLESISVGTLNVLGAIRFLEEPIRYYNACSRECFGDTDGEVADETTPFRPRSPYAVAKAAAYGQVANYRENYGLFASSGILFNHETHLRPERFVTRKIVSAVCRIAKGSTEKLYLGNTAIQRDWGWAPEYVEAMWLMLQRPEPDDFVIATGETHSLEEFVEAAFRCAGLDPSDHVRTEPSLLRTTDILVGRANLSKANRELGWRALHKTKDVVRMMVSEGQRQ